MDTMQPKRRLKAFFKHATIRISSNKDHDLPDDSASTHTIDDDGRSQRSSTSSKKDSKLRRIGREIREWRSKRRRLRGDTRPKTSFTLEGKSFSSSEASLPEEPFEDEDFTDEDEPVHWSEENTHEVGEVVRREASQEKLPCEVIHDEVALRQSATDHVTTRENQSQTIALPTATKRAAQEARALGADVDDLKCLIRLCEELDRWQVFRLGEYNCLEKSLIASIGMRILEQYYGLRRLGAWVEFYWVPAHSGLPGNEVADRGAALSCWWPAKVAIRSAQGTGLVMPMEVLAFDEPWTRHYPHKGQRQYNEYKALQLLEDTKSLPIAFPTKAVGPRGSNARTVGTVRARPGPDGLVLQPASESTCRLLQPPSVRPFPANKDAKMGPSVPPIRTDPLPNHNKTFEPQQLLAPVSQPPPPFPQPQSRVRRVKQRKKEPAAFENLLCTHCLHRGHMINQCFEKFPEQKMAFPERYARYVGRPRLEKVMPGAFHNIARLHPQLMTKSIHGQDSRYVVGRVGISPHLQVKYHWNEAQGAQLD